MALDTRAKRAAAAHLKRLGKGVTPDATPDFLWRSAVAWSYLPASPTPPVGGDDQFLVGLGSPKSFSTKPELGGGSW